MAHHEIIAAVVDKDTQVLHLTLDNNDTAAIALGTLVQTLARPEPADDDDVEEAA